VDQVKFRTCGPFLEAVFLKSCTTASKCFSTH